MSQMNQEEDLGNISDKEPDVVDNNDDEQDEDELDNDSINISEDEDFEELGELDDDNMSQNSNDDVNGVEETKGDDNPNTGQNLSYYISDDDDSEDEEDYLYKLDEDVKNDFIKKHHPEVAIHNFDEVRKFAVVVRNVKGNIVDPLHRTNPIMSKYEYTRILGQRAKQIEGGSKPFVEVQPNIIDSYIIAENELREKKIPFIIRRPIPNGAFEYWNINDLEILI